MKLQGYPRNYLVESVHNYVSENICSIKLSETVPPHAVVLASLHLRARAIWLSTAEFVLHRATLSSAAMNGVATKWDDWRQKEQSKKQGIEYPIQRRTTMIRQTKQARATTGKRSRTPVQYLHTFKIKENHLLSFFSHCAAKVFLMPVFLHLNELRSQDQSENFVLLYALPGAFRAGIANRTSSYSLRRHLIRVYTYMPV